MTEIDYTLFSYYWFFRVETSVFFASILSAVVFVILKFIANRVNEGFCITIMSSVQKASDDVLTRQLYIFRMIQYSIVLICVGLFLLLDPSGNHVFRGESLEVRKDYFDTRKVHAIILMVLGGVQLISAMLTLFAPFAKENEKFEKDAPETKTKEEPIVDEDKDGVDDNYKKEMVG